MDHEEKGLKQTSWIKKFKIKSKEGAVLLGAVAILIAGVDEILDRGKEVVCDHFMDCNQIAAQKPLGLSSTVETSLSSSNLLASYHSKMLGVSFSFPVNLLSLDNTKRQHGKLYLIDGKQIRRVTFSRVPAQHIGSILDARSTEAERLKSTGHSVTYLAPEKSKNIANWYVISGIKNETVFYIRRYYIRGETISYHVNFPKEQQSKYSPFIELLRDKFQITDMH